jgi:hypothetical protein
MHSPSQSFDAFMDANAQSPSHPVNAFNAFDAFNASNAFMDANTQSPNQPDSQSASQPVSQ